MFCDYVLEEKLHLVMMPYFPISNLYIYIYMLLEILVFQNMFFITCLLFSFFFFNFNLSLLGYKFDSHSNIHIKYHAESVSFLSNVIIHSNIIIFPDSSSSSKKEMFKCSACKQTFTSLQDHMCAKSIKRSYICKICQKQFLQKCNLDVHYRIHTGEKPYVCEICQKRFVQKNTLNVHYRTHTKEKPFVCSICYKGYTQKSSLNVHYTTHLNK